MMSWSFKGLFPKKKLLKLFSTTIPFKLRSLNRSKVIKKPNKASLFDKTTKRGGSDWKKKTRGKRNKFIWFLPIGKRPKFLKKRPVPVYIDQLFVGPGPSRLTEPTKSVTKFKEAEVVAPDQETCMAVASSSSIMHYYVDDKAGEDLRMSYGGLKLRDIPNSLIRPCDGPGEADDMWEAVVLAEPEMHRIDERAEEFISRFHAEIKRQKTSEKHL
ncbi:unnamed protein product [Cuscuta europaea]|uniref:Uncharacterized protein n=1 Tax=Cuscuta europaea TaxID=41803 RepID=A0A9P1EBR0_CUSEU|nr:unnamed protein product [Cuscuta europaea]